MQYLKNALRIFLEIWRTSSLVQEAELILVVKDQAHYDLTKHVIRMSSRIKL